MGLLRFAALGAAGYVGYRLWQNAQNEEHEGPAAFAAGHGVSGEDMSPVRDAGPDAMRDTPQHPWTMEDQQSDESFPASDPPGNY
ncbi:MAG: hypothetical protein H6R45_234 [Proteobacteria bacterium]|nr:hypothetical protein [Pseudomonadota bacterium]